MIDTGRHFLSVATIKRAIEGMAMLKLNVLHWYVDSLLASSLSLLLTSTFRHILDSTSFPVESKRFPLLSQKGAYASAAVYSLEELSGIVAFARSRGVRVVVEIEMPGHGAFSAGMPQLATSSCSDVLDPTKESTFTFLREFLTEMVGVFTDPLIYLGGDEVGFDPKCNMTGYKGRVCGYRCFDRDPAIAKWMAAKGMNATQLLDYFWSSVATNVVPKLPGFPNRTVGVWMADRPNGASPYWPPPHMRDLPANAVANVYQSMATAGPILDAGSPVVLSVAGSDWYLDCEPAAGFRHLCACSLLLTTNSLPPSRSSYVRGRLQGAAVRPGPTRLRRARPRAPPRAAAGRLGQPMGREGRRLQL